MQQQRLYVQNLCNAHIGRPQAWTRHHFLSHVFLRCCRIPWVAQQGGPPVAGVTAQRVILVAPWFPYVLGPHPNHGLHSVPGPHPTFGRCRVFFLAQSVTRFGHKSKDWAWHGRQNVSFVLGLGTNSSAVRSAPQCLADLNWALAAAWLVLVCRFSERQPISVARQSHVRAGPRSSVTGPRSNAVGPPMSDGAAGGMGSTWATWG